jgi:tRNA threonylcarbamoyladenosine dehydratase
VGSHTAAALARSGVSRIRLVDFDQVTLSSLNRHAVATLADVGLPKVLCLQRRLMAVSPWVKFDLRVEKFDKESEDGLLGPWTHVHGVDGAKEDGGEGAGDPPTFVIDAIDNIDTKVELLRYCHEKRLPVISSMGAGVKADPTRVTIGDIGTGTDDGLSRAVRRRLKLLGITSGIPIVYSTERGGEGKAELQPLPEAEVQKGKVGDLGVLPDFRIRILPVLGPMPAVFGYTLASYIILKISGLRRLPMVRHCTADLRIEYPVVYAAPNTRSKVYESFQAAVQSGEEKIVRWQTGGSPEFTLGLKVPISTSDAAFIVDEIYLARSAISNVFTRITLIRWRKPKHDILVRIGSGNEEQRSTDVRLRDLVCMTKEEAAIHEREVLKGNKVPEDLYGKDVVNRVETRLKEAAGYEKYRYLI